MAVMHGKLLSKTDARLWITAIWVSSILIATFPLYTGSAEYGLALHPGKVICCVGWWDRSPMTVVMIALSMVTLAISVSFIVYAYGISHPDGSNDCVKVSQHTSGF